MIGRHPLFALNAGIALLVLGAGVASAVQQRNGLKAQAEAARHRPVESAGFGYVSSRECRACHLEQYATWHDSYHRTMTAEATPENVFGDFADVELVDGPNQVRVSRDGDRFFVESLKRNVGFSAEAERERHEIALVTGSHHMQVYWYETGHGRRLGQVPFAYLKEEQRWIPRRSAFLRPPHEPRPDEGGRWNTSCIACHTTLGRPRMDAHGELDTRVAELGIACEACHGPGAQHVKHNTSPLARYQSHLTSGQDDTIVNPRELDHRRSSEICSQCHGIWLFNDRKEEKSWAERGFKYRPGSDPELSMFLLQPSHEASNKRVKTVMRSAPEYVLGQFWSDGMARVSGREFNGMADSPCYTRGEMSCLSCHTMHREPGDTRAVSAWTDDQLKVGMDGDRGCTQCHAQASPQAVTAHTHHAADSAGSRCYNCHMPYTSFGLLKSIRSHQVSSPDAQATIDTGRPNACNLCHLDRSLGWTADALQRLWNVAPPAQPLTEDQRTIAASVVSLLRDDAGERALYAAAFGRPEAQQASGRAWTVPFLGILMDDPYDAVRFIAARSLASLPGDHAPGFDSIVAPSARPAIAPTLPARALAGEALLSIPQAVPLRPDGLPREDVVARLLAARDQRPIDLLE